MPAFAIGVLLAVSVGFLCLRRIDRDSPVDRIVAESLILAPALPAAALFLFSALGIPWSRGALFVCGVLILVVLVALGKRAQVFGNPAREPLGGGLDLTLAIVPFVLVLLLLAGYSQFAFVSAGAENDFIGIWGAKGRAFFEAGRVDWEFLSSPWRGYAHPDYPLLVPLVFSSIAVAVGSWSESFLGLVYPLLALGGLLLAWSELRLRSARASLRWLGVLAVAPFVMSPWIGLADGPLALLVLAALLRLSRWLDDRGSEHLTVGGIFLGLAMSTKNEGIAIGVVAGLIIIRMTPRAERRQLKALWPAAVLAAPWLVLRSIHGLSTDLFEHGAVGRLFGRTFDPDYLFSLGRYLIQFRPGLWLPYVVFVAALVVWRRRLRSGARFLCIAVAVQLLIDVAAYLVTPLPLEWHVRWSWERLVSQVGAVLGVAAVGLLVDLTGEKSGGAFRALVGASPEIEHQEPDTDTDG